MLVPVSKLKRLSLTEIDILGIHILSVNTSFFTLCLQEVLLLDVGHGQWQGMHNEAVLVPAWVSLTAADFSHNSIMSIDESVVSSRSKTNSILSESV